MPIDPAAMQQAIEHQQAGRLRDAEAAYRDILAHDPRCVEALNNLGSVLRTAGQTEASIGCFERALALRPDAAALHFNLANTLRIAGMPERALAAYRRAVALQPDLAVAHNNLGLVLKDLGQRDAARQALEEAIRLDPNYAEAHTNLGSVLHDQRDLSAARACYLRSIELRADQPAAHYNLGLVYEAQCDWASARQHFDEALRYRPQYAEPHCHLGMIELVGDNEDEALAHFDEALAIDPECAEAHYSRGTLLLARGDYEAGWPEYAWHHRCPSYGDRPFDVPAWQGESLAGRTLLIHSDFGFGDALQFVRYLPLVHKRGAGRVVLAVHEALHGLLRESGFGPLVERQAAGERYDCHLSMMDLPCVFRATDETIPPAPYLRAAPADVEHWGRRLHEIEGYRIGIAWQGNPELTWDHLRSIPLAAFEPLARASGARLISLQKGPGCEQIADVAGQFEVVELGDMAGRQFTDTAAIIAGLDLVVCCDTAVAHLAGGLGAPVWLALPRPAEWRWGRRRDTTAWYPSMRLFRQESPGDWASVFNAMAVQLASTPPARDLDR